MIRYTKGHHRVQVHHSPAWEAWQKNKHEAEVYDLLAKHDMQQAARIQAIYCQLSKLKQHGDMLQGLFQRRKDALKVVEERVDIVRDHPSEQAWKAQDQKAKRVYEHAAERVKWILEAKDHFGKEKQPSGKENRAKARQRKSDLLANLPQQADPEGHRWSAEKRGYKCQQCDLYVTSQTPYAELTALAGQVCEKSRPATLGGKSLTRDQFLQQLLEGQLEGVPADQHEWEVTNHYLRCKRCSMQKLKRSRQEVINGLLESKCYHGSWEPPHGWNGHPTHRMQRRANAVFCERCNGKGIPEDGQFKASAKLKQVCKLTPQKSLRSFFQQEVEEASVGYF